MDRMTSSSPTLGRQQPLRCGFAGWFFGQAVNDWGDMPKGHGGMLWRSGSVVFAAPVFFHGLRKWRMAD
jgi:hypothetical protein